MVKGSLIPERMAAGARKRAQGKTEQGDMVGQSASTDYERFQRRLFFAVVRWMNTVLAVAVLINSYWFLIDFQSTLIQDGVALLLILIGVGCLHLARRGRMRLASRVYLLIGMGLLASVLLIVGEHFILNIAAGLYILVFIGTFLDRPERAAWWAGAGMVFYFVGLTLRIVLPWGELAYSAADVAALYLFPILLLAGFALLGHRLAGGLREALTESEQARSALQRRNQELSEAQAVLEATNAQLHLDLAARVRVEQQLRINQKELRALLHEKEILLQEVHHRVKNNLQVISSLLDMQSYFTQDALALHSLQDSQSRVRTMAFVHERLYRSHDLESVDAREYIHSIADYLGGLYAHPTKCIDLTVEVDDICMDLDTAIPCGLIANELISNALKHAFPGAGECDGEVHVALRSRENGTMRLTVGDSGVGLPPGVTLGNGQSLGLRLVQMLARELDGEIELQTGSGTIISITFDQQERQSTQEEERCQPLAC
jgi:two-component sensor histidine kinase